MKRLLTFLVLCLPIYLFAQGFGSFSHDQPYFAKDQALSTISDLPHGVAFRWVASDLSSSPVSIWTDRIQGRNLVQPAGANQPLWATNAVIFDADANLRYLQLTNPITINLGTSNGNNHALLIVASSAQTGTTRFLVDADGGGFDAFLWQGFSGVWRDNQMTEAQLANKNYEYLYAGRSGTAGARYANGVAVGVGLGVGYNTTWTDLGRHYDGTFYWNGTVKEIVIWTNVATRLSDAEISQIHNYVTNTYNPSTF